MNPETIYQQCREAVQILLAALEAGDIALVEHQVRAVRAYLGQRDHGADRGRTGISLLRVEQLDAIEAINNQIERCLLTMRASAHEEFERMRSTEDLLRHLTFPSGPPDTSSLPVF